MSVRVVLCVGSNADGHLSTMRARTHLERLLTDVRHGEMMETEPIGISSGPFTNSFTMGETTLDLNSLSAALKRIETLCGNRRSLRKSGIVKLDIDILLYGTQRLHESDWNRAYIRDNIELFINSSR